MEGVLASRHVLLMRAISFWRSKSSRVYNLRQKNSKSISYAPQHLHQTLSGDIRLWTGSRIARRACAKSRCSVVDRSMFQMWHRSQTSRNEVYGKLIATIPKLEIPYRSKNSFASERKALCTPNLRAKRIKRRKACSTEWNLHVEKTAASDTQTTPSP
jgi:hypothetical protein